MTVIAQGSITIYHVKDIASVTWYYKLQSGTLNPPEKPTTSPPPTTWKDSEPAYNEGSTDSLYVVERTIFSDGSFSYSEVSLSSSYEAAKVAYNKAHNAGNIATEAKDAIDNLSIGGRNLIKNTLYPDVSKAANYPRLVGQTANTAVPGGTKTTAEHGIKIEVSSATRPYVRFGASSISSATMNGLKAGQTYTLSFDAEWKVLSGTLSNTNTYYMRAYLYSDKTTVGTFAADYYNFASVTPEDRGEPMSGRCEFTFTVAETVTMLYLLVQPSLSTSSAYASGDYVELRNIKLEKGTKATDWTPAPEDTAGDFLKYSQKVTASAAINTGRLGVFNNTGELIVLSTTAFDVTMPILYIGSDVAAGENTDANTYIAMGDPIDLTKTKSGFSGTAGKPVYIVGNLSEKMFTPDSAIFTCTEPLTQDGKSYMLLGVMTSSTEATLYSEHLIMQYHNGFKTIGQIAIEAAIEANTAYKTANGKNSVFYSASAPSVTGRKDGDLWFDTDDDNKLYSFSSTAEAWEAKLFGNNALYNNIDAGKITAGTIDASKINVTNLNASNISSGSIDASLISVTNIDAAQITSGYLSAERIASGSIITEMLDAGAVTAEKIDVTDLYAIAAYIGAIHITQSSIYSGSHNTYNSSNAGFYMNKDGKFGVGNSAGYIRWDGSNLAIAASTLAWTATNSSMTSTGELTIKKATIGNITVTSSAIYSNGKVAIGTAVDGFHLNSNGHIGIGDGTDNYILWNGTALTIKTTALMWTSDNSSLSSTGVLTAKGVNISGKITATEGSIGGWSINSYQLYKNSYSGNPTSGAYRAYLQSTNYNGALYNNQNFIGVQVYDASIPRWNNRLEIKYSGDIYSYGTDGHGGSYRKVGFENGYLVCKDINNSMSGNTLKMYYAGLTADKGFIFFGGDKTTGQYSDRVMPPGRCIYYDKDYNVIGINSNGSRTSGAYYISVVAGSGSNGSEVYTMSSSSKRYKDYIGEETDDDALKLLDLPVIQFKYKDGYLDQNDENFDKTMVGLFAEDVAEQFEDAVYHNNGYVENYTDRQLLVRLIKLAQIQHREIEQLKQAAS